MHIDPSDLRAYLDGALAPATQAAAAAHLAECGQCRQSLAVLEARAAHVRQHLAAVAPAPTEAARTARAALQLLKERQRKDRIPMVKSLAKRRSIWVGAAAVLALALSLSFAPVRTFAGQFLGLFRVQQIAVLPMDMARLASLHDDPTLTDQLSRMFADTVTISQEPGEPVTAASADEASALAGFDVRELGGAEGVAEFTITGHTAFEVIIDQPRAQAILNEAGRPDLVLPESVNGATIAVDIPKAVNVAYDCPELEEPEDDKEPGGRDWSGDVSALTRCVLLGQIPSPSVETPPNLDMVQLAELGLQFTGMTPSEAHAFSQSVDWTSTLVVPIPSNASVNEQVTVDGVNGTLLYRPSNEGVPERYTLMWVKDGIVYALSAFGTPEEAVALANTIE